jgi:hypothetical protein
MSTQRLLESHSSGANERAESGACVWNSAASWYIQGGSDPRHTAADGPRGNSGRGASTELADARTPGGAETSFWNRHEGAVGFMLEKVRRCDGFVDGHTASSSDSWVRDARRSPLHSGTREGRVGAHCDEPSPPFGWVGRTTCPTVEWRTAPRGAEERKGR